MNLSRVIIIVYNGSKMYVNTVISLGGTKKRQ